MKFAFATSAIVSLLALGACQTHGPQDAAAAGSYDSSTVDPAQFSEEMAKLGQTGTEHERLAKLIGEWDLQARIRWSPTADWTESAGTSKCTSLLGGRYILEEISFTVDGVTQQAVMIYGFDRLQNGWFVIRLDTMSTWPNYLFGEEGPDEMITLHGRRNDWATPGGRPCFLDFKVAEDKIETMAHDTIDGETVLVAHVTRTRRG